MRILGNRIMSNFPWGYSQWQTAFLAHPTLQAQTPALIKKYLLDNVAF